METLLQDVKTSLNKIYKKTFFVSKYDINVQVIVTEFIGLKMVDTPYVFGFECNWNTDNSETWNLYTQNVTFDENHGFYCEHNPDTIAMLASPVALIEEALQARNVLDIFVKVLPQIIAMLNNFDEYFIKEYSCGEEALQCFNKEILYVTSPSVRLHALTNRLLFPNQTVKRMLSIEIA